jgi:diguanylate cyclase (GGDEF)-like protein
MHPSVDRDYQYLLSRLIPRHLLSSGRLAGIQKALARGGRREMLEEAYRAMEELVAQGVFRSDGVHRGDDGCSISYSRTDYPSTITLVMSDEEFEGLTRMEGRRAEILPSVLAGILSSLALNDSPKTVTSRLDEMLSLASHISPGATAKLLILSAMSSLREWVHEGIAHLSMSEAMRRRLYRSCLAGGMSHAFARLAGEHAGESAFVLSPQTNSIVLIPLAAGDAAWALLEIHQRGGTPPERTVLSNFELLGQGITRLFENNRHLEKMVSIDRLTKVYNRNHYESQLPLEIERANRNKMSFAFLIMDIDDFKGVNDVYGHDVGDRVLRMVAQTTRKHLRKIDLLFRYGGEEFIVLLPGATEESARRTAERIREVVAKAEHVAHGGSRVRVAVSIGGCIYPDWAQNETQLFRMADRALYRAKEGGKNRVEFSGRASA